MIFAEKSPIFRRIHCFRNMMMEIANLQNTMILRDATRQGWLLFQRPGQIIQVRNINDVLPALKEIEIEVNRNQRYAAGFISYEAAPAFDSACAVHTSEDFPLMWFGIYDDIQPLPITKLTTGAPIEGLQWQATISREEYRQAIAKIKQHIASGDTYQVNYTYRLLADFQIDPWPFFMQLAQAQYSIYGAFLNTEQWAVCSASPELFFQLDDHHLISRPMKGTVPRAMTAERDREQKAWLRASLKNQAENAMIVDMVRNDIGRIADAGTVTVSSRFDIEKYPTVWQMTSAVSGKTGAGICGILKALFPAASITGAPKISTMKIIRELETTPRRIYTGSIGFSAPGGRAQFNVAIRTVLIDKLKKRAEYGVGGGIVWDSTDAGEYEESKTKASILTGWPLHFSLLETMRWSPASGYYLLDQHLSRLTDSAEYFSIPADSGKIKAALASLAESFGNQDQRVRLLISERGDINCEAQPLSQDASSLLKVTLAETPVNAANPFLYHKTTHREVYDWHLSKHSEAEDVLLWNNKGELTEFCLGNLVVEIGGIHFTPLAECGLLNGTFREMLLGEGKIQEKILCRDDLAAASKIFRINSVRAWQQVAFLSKEIPKGDIKSALKTEKMDKMP